jgi:Ni/Co efflux regulator RcnB
MHKIMTHKSRFLALLIAGLLFSAPAFAEKPEWAGNKGGKQKHHKKYEQSDDGRREDEGHGEDSHGDNINVNVDVRFGDHDREVIHDYYDESERSGRCPPGLRKKHNGCMPPGQAKKWQMGRPLPREVIYHDLPPRIIVEIGAPPAGHKYVRVAADILLIAVGTGMVVDAIEDLGRI